MTNRLIKNKLILGLSFLAFVIFISAAPAAFADAQITHKFANASGPLTNVTVISAACADEFCYTVDESAFNYTGNSGLADNLTITYLENLATAYGYVEYFLADGYAPMQFISNWKGNTTTPFDAGTTTFYKISNCKAPIDYINVSNAMPTTGENVTITVGVKSAFLPSGSPPFNISFNSSLAPYYSSQVKTNLTIKNSTGDVIGTASNTTEILANGSQDVVWNLDIPTYILGGGTPGNIQSR